MDSYLRISMSENVLQQIVCKIVCGSFNGTGFLVSENRLLTARHCITDYIHDKKEIEIFLEGKKLDTDISLVHEDADIDIAILEVDTKFDVTRIQLSAIQPRQKMKWSSLGFLEDKSSGQFVYGQVANILSNTVARADIDLTIDPEYALSDYSGLSGAPVTVENRIVGILRLQSENSLNALSIYSCKDILTKFHIDFEPDSEPEDIDNGIVIRNDFQNSFENKLLSLNTSNMLLVGVHGIGKTTFCREFTPLNSSVLFGGTYSLTSDKNGKSTLVKAQPEELYDWLSVKISNLLSLGVPEKPENLSLSKIQYNVSDLFRRLSEHYKDKNKTIVFFIDAINELILKDQQSLNTLLAILPVNLPDNIKIVFSSTSYEVVSTCISEHITKDAIIALPVLTEREVVNYCSQHIDEDLLDSDLIDKVISIAEGHPLYLTYITNYVNKSKDISLENFPIFSGTIENYYENIWNRIVNEHESLFLLGIICRLREEIRSDSLKLTLDDNQRKQYISTINKISHLLITEDGFVAIYHNSFAEFLKSRTEDIADLVNSQLAKFCLNNPDIKYTKINLIYHLLQSQEHKKTAINSCNQQWVDECVTVGVQPDQLLYDIKQALSFALNIEENRADSVNTIRLLLLLDRIEFRYNTTFVSDVSLTANALISLEKPDEVLNQIIRYDLLLTDPYQTFDIIKSLNDHGYEELALKIVQILSNDIMHRFEETIKRPSDLDEYVLIYKCLLMVQVLFSYILNESRINNFQNIMQSFRGLLNSNQIEDSDQLMFTSRVAGTIISSNLRLNSSADQEFDFGTVSDSTKLLLPLFSAIADLYTSMDTNILKTSLEYIFKNINKLLDIENSIKDYFNDYTVNMLFELNAPNELINKLITIYSYSNIHNDISLKLTLDNNVDVDIDNIHKYYITKSILHYINSSLDEPQIHHFNDTDYLAFFRSIIESLAYCNGRLKFLTEDINQTETQSIKSKLSALVDSLLFTLKDRTDWESSYSIPEHLAPILWKYISTIYKRYLPNDTLTLLKTLNSKFDSQFGLYNEGFRRSLNNIINNLIIGVETNPEIEDEIFELLNKWKNYVLKGVQNRHELIPELFQLIIYFNQINAPSIAEQIYQEILAHSMGPSWYKEDRFSLLTDTLKLIDNTNITSSSQIIEIANCLERASGEMTFQRYVRQAKDDFVGVLCSKGLYQTSFSYYKRQVAGSTPQLKEDVQKGSVDFVTPIRGMNYPGAQLIEQDCILQIVSNANDVHWRLKWALLEIFQCGDERYFNEFAIEFAKLFNSNTNDIDQNAMQSRLRLIVDTELSQSDRDKFLTTFLDNVSAEKQLLLCDFFDFTPSKPKDKFQTSISKNQQNTGADTENTVIDPASSLIKGEIGKLSVLQETEGLETNINKHLKRDNIQQAKQEAIKILKKYQDNEWGVWGRKISDTQTFAEEVITSNSNSDEIINLFKELIESENYTSSWRVAEKLISIIDDKFSDEQTLELMDIVLDHIQLIIGKTNQKINWFNEILNEEDNIKSPDKHFLHFLFWLLSHPVYLTATKTASLLYWILGSLDQFLPEVIKIAFNEDGNFIGDVLTGILDVLSTRKQSNIQTLILQNTNINQINHLSRLVVLRRILSRRSNELDIKDTIRSIDDKFLSANQNTKSSTNSYSFNPYLECLNFEISQLNDIGLWNEGIESQVITLLTQQFLPLDIAEAFELENMLCDSFRRPRKTLTTRWEGYVRSALNKALLPYVTLEDAQEVETILRPYNPYATDSKMRKLSNPLSENVTKALSIKKNPYLLKANDELILNYVEFCMPDDSLNELACNPYRVEVKAIIIQNNEINFDDILNRTEYKLFAKDYLQNIETHPLSIYTSVGPSSAFLGSYTPSIPTPQFMRITNKKLSDFNRSVWRNGRTNDSANFGRPYSEGCMLTVKDSSIILPSNMQLAWIIEIDGKLVTIVNQYNQGMNI